MVAPKYLYVIIRKPQGVAGDYVRAKQAQRVQIFHGRKASMGLAAVFYLLAGLAEVDVDPQPVFPRIVESPEDLLFQDSKDSVDREHRTYPGDSGHLLEERHAGIPLHLGLHWIHPVEQDV